MAAWVDGCWVVDVSPKKVYSAGYCGISRGFRRPACTSEHPAWPAHTPRPRAAYLRARRQRWKNHFSAHSVPLCRHLRLTACLGASHETSTHAESLRPDSRAVSVTHVSTSDFGFLGVPVLASGLACPVVVLPRRSPPRHPAPSSSLRCPCTPTYAYPTPPLQNIKLLPTTLERRSGRVHPLR